VAEAVRALTRLIDCGASRHMTGDSTLLEGVQVDIDVPVTGISGQLRATKVASGHVSIGGVRVLLKELYYVPGMTHTLISVSDLVEDGYGLSFGMHTGVNSMILSRGAHCLLQVPAQGGLYPIRDDLLLAAAATIDADLFHKRCGHVSWTNQAWAKRVRAVYGDGLGKGCSNSQCEACMRAKMHRIISRLKPTRPAIRPLQRVLFDFSPNVPVVGIGGQTGMLMIVDEFTRRWFPYCIRSKAEVVQILRDFKVMAEAHFTSQLGEVHQLAAIRSDGENVNVSKDVAEWCARMGIVHEVSAAYSQWQNGIVERAIGVAWEGAEAMRKDAGAPARYWPFSLLAFAFTRNLLALGEEERSPYEEWHGVDIPLDRRLSRLRVWGSKCYAYVDKKLRRKFDDKAQVCVHLGYSPTTNGYWLVNIETGLFFTAVSVRFDESSFPFRGKAFGTTGSKDITVQWPAMPRMPAGVGADRLHMQAPVENLDVSAVSEASEFSSASSPSAEHEWLFGEESSNLGSTIPALEHSTPDFAPDFGQGFLGPGLDLLDDEYEAQDLIDFRVRRVVQEFGGSPRPQRQFLVRWKGRDQSADSWEPQESFPCSPQVFASAVQRMAGKISGLEQLDDVSWSSFDADLSDASCDVSVSGPGSGSVSGLGRGAAGGAGLGREAVSGSLGREASVGGPGAEGAEDGVSLDDLDDDMEADASLFDQSPSREHSDGGAGGTSLEESDDNMNGDVSLFATAGQLEASMASIAVDTALAGGRLQVGASGEVWVPAVNPLALEKLRISQSIHGSALDPETVAKVRDRIALLALAAKATLPPPYKVPWNYYEAAVDHNWESWLGAMEKEMENMEDFGVWELVPRPVGKNIMSCKWVFTIKRDVNGFVDKLKARLTSRGFTQRAGVDYDDTWAPTCRLRVFRMLMAEASSDPSIMTAQWDCTAAFLHAPVDYEMYMEQAPGFIKGGVHLVYRLNKAIYGCKQSARLFFQVVRDFLLSPEVGATQAKADECLYIVRAGSSWVRILVHVDDFAVFFNDRGLYDKVFRAMQQRFRITDYGGGPIRKFVGVCVERTSAGFYRLHQKPYIEEILKRLGLDTAKHALSPERVGTAGKLRMRSLTPAEAEYMQDVPFKESVGALFYLCRGTRFDIAHSVSEVARFMENPAPEHWEAVLRIYRYLARTIDLALVMRSSGMQCEVTDQFLEGFSDSDWAGCVDSRRSHTGWLVIVGGSPVSWYSKRQSSVSQSTTEAEYVAAAAVANELVWWRRLCDDLGYDCDGPVTVWCDNRSATTLAEHECNFEAAKHIQLRYHVLRDYQKRGIVRVRWRRSDTMWADILTKNCSYPHFSRIVGELMGEKLPPAKRSGGRPSK
jgi:hypothetical protein